jgi:carbamoyl-phosphate synthase large subunit
MKSVGEAMAIGRTFAESLQKALRSMETGLDGLDEVEIPGYDGTDTGAVRAALAVATPERILVIAQAFREGLSVDEIQTASKYDPWFLDQIRAIVDAEAGVRARGLPKMRDGLLALKAMGFSDARLATLAALSEADVAAARKALAVVPAFKRVDTCAAEYEARTPYLYSTYESDSADGSGAAECEAQPSGRRKAIILGGGPNRIGQGIEFDYCCVHAAYALNEAGIETIMINCNPETVSTDYDTSDRLYFEPLTVEDVLEVVRAESARGELLGVIVQFGGQTPLRIAAGLAAAKVPILGTSPDAIDLAEDRERFQKLLQKLGLKQPPNGLATNAAEAEAVAERIGFPVVIRPSYVLGGRAMEIVRDKAHLLRYIDEAVRLSGSNPVLIDGYLQNAIEVDVDAVADGGHVFVAGIMEHIEEAGIHSGDSACSLPPYSLGAGIIDEIRSQSEALARALGVVGLMNVQFAVQGEDIYVLEVNPRASRTVPFVAKATGVAVAKIAALVMAGRPLKEFGLKQQTLGHVAVKEAVFPFARFPGVDTILGPEMKSTGEVMGIDRDFERAFAKSQVAAGANLPQSGTVFISVKDADKEPMAESAKRLVELGFRVMATSGTADFLERRGLGVERINKVQEGRPHIVDAMKNGDVDLVFNTTEGTQAVADSYELRRTALTHAISYYTTVAGARAAVQAIGRLRVGGLDVAPLQSYF